MNEETNFPAIEERLQADARRLLTAEHGVCASRLANVYRRRQRRRRAAQAAGAAAAVVLLAIVAVRSGGRPAEQAPPAAEQATVAQLGTSAGGQRGTDGTAAPRRWTAMEQPDHTLFAIPFVIGNPEASEDVITGIYVPEQVESIDLGKLSPAERDAVRAVLGVESDDTDVIQPI
ncbi:MAG TPA: hypothetical protein VG826_24420 [Pirellulales bacterium]|nr:hypothetical protein [Pirellulales bacterium]